MSDQTVDRWPRSLEEHAATVTAFLAAASALSPDQWDQPLGIGKWSPSRIVEHVRLCYEVFATELAGGAGLRVRTSFWLRTFLRLRYLDRLLSTGDVPHDRAPAPREVRPGPGPFHQDVVIASLREAAARFEMQLRGRAPTAVGITHHLFGPLSASQAVRFSIVHTGHHRTQLAALAAHESSSL